MINITKMLKEMYQNNEIDESSIPKLFMGQLITENNDMLAKLTEEQLNNAINVAYEFYSSSGHLGISCASDYIRYVLCKKTDVKSAQVKIEWEKWKEDYIKGINKISLTLIDEVIQSN